MAEEKIKVFQVDDSIVKNAYENLDNYLIERDNSKQNLNICTVYFSSNYIYFPNNKNAFKKSIIDKNRFEWYNIRNQNATKHIFIRDIHKQWYLYGINSEINSIEKVIAFLAEETEGYKTYFVGSSAGGYASVLMGSLLGVDRIYSYNSQFFLTDLLENSSEIVDPILFREKENSQISKYYKIKSYISDPLKIFYFHSNKSKWDVSQKKEIEDLGINIISVNTSIHGIPILKNNLKHVFLLNQKELANLTKAKLHPINFSFKIVGFRKTILFLMKLTPNAFKRWILNPIIKKMNSFKK